jgi:hypothetical protein
VRASCDNNKIRHARAVQQDIMYMACRAPVKPMPPYFIAYGLFFGGERFAEDDMYGVCPDVQRLA